jgi:hypothetical protein
MPLTRLVALLVLLPLLRFTPAAAQDAPSESPRRRGPYAEFVSALRKGDTKEAFTILDKLPEDHPDFLRTMSEAGRILAESGQPARGLPYAQRAYDKAPDDMEVVHAFIRCELLARTNLTAPLIARKLPKKAPREFQFISTAPKFPDDSKKFSREKLLADLDYLEVALANAYSYADRRGADWPAALDALRASLADETPLDTFTLRLRRFITLFGDPHTALHVTTVRDFLPAGAAPFLPVADGTRVLALKPNRSAFLDDDCRYLAAIDGVKIVDWLRVAGFDVPKASPQFERRQTVASLAQLNYLRTELDLPQTNHVTLTLANASGKKEKKLTLPVAEKSTRSRSGADRKTRELDGHIGYLRIASMDAEPAFLAQLNDSMTSFRDTRGLVIDVRGNGGGSQDTVKTILPYFLAPDAPMKIINVAAYRLPVKLPRPCAEGYLGLYGRGLHPLTSTNWTTAQHDQIAAFLRTFKPTWKLPLDRTRFSDWHIMGISAATNPKAYHYTNAVVILTDAGCFSATDNFLGALKGQSNIALLGTTSGGGSGRMASYTLPNTKLPLTICQMASFRANGDIFDGRGVAPDVVLEPKPEDHLKDGGDSVLDAALARLKKQP